MTQVEKSIGLFPKTIRDSPMSKSELFSSATKLLKSASMRFKFGAGDSRATHDGIHPTPDFSPCCRKCRRELIIELFLHAVRYILDDDAVAVDGSTSELTTPVTSSPRTRRVEYAIRQLEAQLAELNQQCYTHYKLIWKTWEHQDFTLRKPSSTESVQPRAEREDVDRPEPKASTDSSASSLYSFRGLLSALNFNVDFPKFSNDPFSVLRILSPASYYFSTTSFACSHCGVWINPTAICRCSGDCECFPCSLAWLQYAVTQHTQRTDANSCATSAFEDDGGGHCGPMNSSPCTRSKRGSRISPSRTRTKTVSTKSYSQHKSNRRSMSLPSTVPRHTQQLPPFSSSFASTSKVNLRFLEHLDDYIKLTDTTDGLTAEPPTDSPTVSCAARGGKRSRCISFSELATVLVALLPDRLRYLPPTHYCIFFHGLNGNAKDYFRFRNHMVNTFPDLHCFIPDCYSSKSFGGVELLTTINRNYLFFEPPHPWGVGRLPLTTDLICHLLGTTHGKTREVSPDKYSEAPLSCEAESQQFVRKVSRPMSDEPLLHSRSKIFLSFIGHSLGGIIARSLLLLDRFIQPRTDVEHHRVMPPPKLLCEAKRASSSTLKQIILSHRSQHHSQPGDQSGEHQIQSPGSQQLAMQQRVFLSDVSFVNFVTFASPHNGIYESNGGVNTISFLIPTGRDLATTSNELQRLCSPSAVLVLCRFKNLALYGNVSNDYLVGPYTSLAIDPLGNAGNRVATHMDLEFLPSISSDEAKDSGVEFPSCVRSACYSRPQFPVEMDECGYLVDTSSSHYLQKHHPQQYQLGLRRAHEILVNYYWRCRDTSCVHRNDFSHRRCIRAWCATRLARTWAGASRLLMAGDSTAASTQKRPQVTNTQVGTAGEERETDWESVALSPRQTSSDRSNGRAGVDGAVRSDVRRRGVRSVTTMRSGRSLSVRSPPGVTTIHAARPSPDAGSDDRRHPMESLTSFDAAEGPTANTSTVMRTTGAAVEEPDNRLQPQRNMKAMTVDIQPASTRHCSPAPVRCSAMLSAQDVDGRLQSPSLSPGPPPKRCPNNLLRMYNYYQYCSAPQKYQDTAQSCRRPQTAHADDPQTPTTTTVPSSYRVDRNSREPFEQTTKMQATPFHHIRFFHRLPWRRFGVYIPSTFRAHACIIWHGRLDNSNLGEPTIKQFADDVFVHPLYA